nr:uncharacterized protein LOC129166991 [Nothobranchius furzeri]
MSERNEPADEDEDSAEPLREEEQLLRRGARQRTLTEKGKALQEEKIKALTQRFNYIYKKWKAHVKFFKHSSKQSSEPLSEGLLNDILGEVKGLCADIQRVYEDLRKLSTPDQETRRRVDLCVEISNFILSKASRHLEGQAQEEEQVWPEAGSFWSTSKSETESITSVMKSATSEHSKTSSVKRQEAAADAAASQAVLKVLKEQEREQLELQRLEAEAKKRIAAQEAAAKQRRLEQEEEEVRRRKKKEEEEATMTAKVEEEHTALQMALEEKRRRINHLETMKELSAAQARMQVYDQGSDIKKGVKRPISHKMAVHVKPSSQTSCQQSSIPFVPQQLLSSSSNQDTAGLVKLLADALNANRIPLPEPSIFSGDPLKYSDWKLSFQTLIDQKNIQNKEKIYYLRKYVGGQVKNALDGYFLLGTESAYVSAWEILEERYGNPFTVATAYRDKLQAWAKIGPKDSTDLREFADFLRSCEAAMVHIKALEILNDCSENRKILAKLPDWLTARWNRKVMEMEEENGQFPSFSQFVRFLTRESKIACNPITSLQSLKLSDKSKQQNVKVKTLVTRSNEETINICVFCKKHGHTLHTCRKFMQDEVSDRVKFVKAEKLCFGCLNSGHFSKSCNCRSVCNICNKQHPTCLHEERDKREQRAAQVKQSQVHETFTQGNNKVNPQTRLARDIVTASTFKVNQIEATFQTAAIIPVWLSYASQPVPEVLVYALLDSQSDTTFVLSDAADSLEAPKEQVKLKLSTMTSQTTTVRSQRVNNLRVRGFYSNKRINLPPAYTRDFIPANRAHIPTDKTAEAWSHLEHLKYDIAPLQDCEVGLLIGYNCSQAFLPREVVSGQDNEPFAQRTDLGWSIVGHSNPCVKYGDAIGVSHRIVVRQVKPKVDSALNLKGEVHYVNRSKVKERKSNLFSGPTFLWQNELPASKYKIEVQDDDPELRRASVFNTKAKESRSLLERFEKFSDWSRLVKAVARLKRRVAEHKRLKQRTNEGTSLEERKDAEIAIVKLVQREAFPDEIQSLKAKEGVVKTKYSKLKGLNPTLDEDGVLRVGGRLNQSALHPHIKHPVILPKNSHISSLLVKHFHERIHHQGRGMTVNELRANGWWILGSSGIVSSHIFKCVKCRKYRRCTETQKMGDLPQDRMETMPPFTYTGMDCFGPIYVKEGRKEDKRYGLLLTCLCSRAIHIEMLDDMTTDAFINALRAFIAIRGNVRLLRCDQGTNFIGAKRELAELIKGMEEERVKTLKCEFLMNPPAASHMGGIWERQIRTIRSVLTSILDNSAQRLDSSSLRTLFYEIMAIVNSRPLTVENLNDPSAPEPLTPNHILTMKSTIILPPPGQFVKEDLYLKKRWRRVQYLANEFWIRWKKEYLLSLQQRQKWQKTRRNMKVNDIVLLQNEQAPRNEWKLARIAEVYPGLDEKVRKVRLLVGDTTFNGKGKPTTKTVFLDRPVHKLVTLIEANESN